MRKLNKEEIKNLHEIMKKAIIENNSDKKRLRAVLDELYGYGIIDYVSLAELDELVVFADKRREERKKLKERQKKLELE